MISFARPDLLYALFGLPVVLGFLYWGVRRRLRRLAIFQRSVSEELRKFYTGLGKVIVGGLLYCILVLCAAGPRFGYEWQDIQRRGVDIIVGVDVSKSMLARDLSPNRIDVARRQVEDLVNNLQGDRIAIVPFAGSAYVQCPLTVDYQAAKLFLDVLNTDLIADQGTDFSNFFTVAKQSLDKGGSKESSGKVILLLTDGEDQEATYQTELDALAKEGIRVFTFGLGSVEGAPVVDEVGAFKKDARGSVVISKLGVNTLKDIASKTGGQFVQVTSNLWSLGDFYKTEVRPGLSDTELKSYREKIWYERFQWFVALAILVLVFESLLSDHRRFKSAAKIVGVLLISFVSCLFLGDVSFAKDTDGLVNKGVEAYKKGDYHDAARQFKEAESLEPSNAKHLYNLGVAEFQDGNYDAAREDFQRGLAAAAQSSDTALQARTLYNLGNTEVARGDLEAAARAFQESLKLDPNDQGTRENLEWVEKQLDKKRQEEQQQNKDNQNQKNNQDDKQQQNGKQDDKQSPKPSPQKDGDKNQQKDQQSKDQNEKDRQGEKPKDDSKEPGKEKSVNQPAPSPEPSGQNSQRDARQQPMPSPTLSQDAKDAERVLRSVQDRPSKFFAPLQQKKHQQRDKDW